MYFMPYSAEFDVEDARFPCFGRSAIGTSQRDPSSAGRAALRPSGPRVTSTTLARALSLHGISLRATELNRMSSAADFRSIVQRRAANGAFAAL
jgi:hypothetical protein